MQLPDDDLRRAAANVARLGEYLAVRGLWTVPDAARDALESTRDAAAGLRERISVTYPQVAPELSPEAPADPLPPQPFDGARLERMAGFLEQLEVWFESRTNQGLSPDGVEILGDMIGRLIGVAQASSDLLAAASETAPLPPPAPPPEAPPPGAPERLVLEDTEATPLLQEFKGTAELTAEAKELLGEFLAAYGVTLPPSNRRQLDHKVLRWLEATPDGHVLVLKMTTMHGNFDPYPVYEPRPEPAPSSPA